MTKEEAKEALMHHSFTHEDFEHKKSERGFLGALRPFKGNLKDENYHEVINAIKILAEDLRDTEKVDREVMSAIWGICHLTRTWALEKDGMLRRNKLITSDQIEKLENWVHNISYATMMILDGNDNSTAFSDHTNYLKNSSKQ